MWRACEHVAGVLEGMLRVELAGTFPLSEAARAHRLLEGRGVTGKLLP